MKLYIDDIRSPPEGWKVARTSQEALGLLQYWQQENISLEEISFDQDLGGDNTTRPVVRWMTQSGFWPLRCSVHTANPVGRQWLEGMIERYQV